MASDASLPSVMIRLRQGDPSAAEEIFHRYVTRLVALASHKIGDRFQAKADPEDVVQSVYKSFFARDGRKPFDLEDWDSLWALLATITLRKCSERKVYWMAARRHVAREVHQPGGLALDEPIWEAIDQGPTPIQAMYLIELMESLLVDLPPDHRTIAELTLQGYLAREVADQVGCSERTVARVTARLKDRLREASAPEEAG